MDAVSDARTSHHLGIHSDTIEITNMFKRVSQVFGLLLLAFLAVPILGNDADAQALRVGYTDHEIILINMPDYQDVQQKLQEEYAGSQQELQTLYQDYQEQLNRYQNQQSLLSEESRTKREQELIELQQSIQQQAQEKDQQLARREAELMQPLLERVQKAIDTVAEKNSLDLVLRSQLGAQPVLLYVNEQTVMDITLDVARELGLDVSEAEAAQQQPASSN